MKLHEIRKDSKIFVAKLPSNMTMINYDLKALQFKPYTTKETKCYYAEWCKPLKQSSLEGNSVSNKMVSSFSNSHKIVFEVIGNDTWVAIVENSDISFFVNISNEE